MELIEGVCAVCGYGARRKGVRQRRRNKATKPSKPPKASSREEPEPWWNR